MASCAMTCGRSHSIAKVLRYGFTLIELIVTIAVIGTLIALMLPAIQAARESGRRTQCQSNLKQIAIALLSHHQMHGSFPAGGWGHEWVGVPGRGSNSEQPGGWIYSLLPYIEEQNLHRYGDGLDGPAATDAYSVRVQTPIAILVCPSRRECAAWPIANSYPYVRTPKPYGNVNLVARSDYAINAGTCKIFSLPGPVDLTQGDNPKFWRDKPNSKGFTGICHLRVGASLDSVRDGASNTYLVGEKQVDAAEYATGESRGDNESLYAGYCSDLNRFTGRIEALPKGFSPFVSPLSDVSEPDPDFPSYLRFGSAHHAAFSMVFCDGSVRTISYLIDPEVHFRSGDRKDRGRELRRLTR